MKLTISIFTVLFSLQAYANNTLQQKTQRISSVGVAVEECRGPDLHEVWAPVVIPSGGDVSVTTSTTTIVANAYFNEKKCITEETFLVKTTGVEWLGTKKVFEIPGSRKRLSRLENVSKSIQLAHSIYEYKFENLAKEFTRVKNVLNEKTSTACMMENQKAQNLLTDISETECRDL